LCVCTCDPAAAAEALSLEVNDVKSTLAAAEGRLAAVDSFGTRLSTVETYGLPLAGVNTGESTAITIVRCVDAL
jgi:hypothetical protein